MPTAAKSIEPHKKWWQRAYAYTQTQGIFNYWQLPKAEEEMAGLFKMVEAGSMSAAEVYDLIAVTDRLGLDEMAAEFPLVADKIAEMLEYRKQVGECFQNIVIATEAIAQNHCTDLPDESHFSPTNATWTRI